MHPLMKTSMSAPCEHCGSLRDVTDESIRYYFESKFAFCDRCGYPTSLYYAVLNALQGAMSPLLYTTAATLIGAESVAIPIKIEKHKLVELDLTQYGVPHGSQLLRVSYTSYGSLHPLEWHGNQPIWEPLLKRLLYGMEMILSGDKPADACDVSVLVSYIPPQPEQLGIYSLTKAYSHLLAGQWGQMSIAAITGIESTLKSLLRAHFKAQKNSKKLDGVKDIEYLTELYPEYCQGFQIPEVEGGIMHYTKKLWKTRNEYAHQGRLFPGYAEPNAVEQLCAALFLYRHIREFGAAYLGPLR